VRFETAEIAVIGIYTVLDIFAVLLLLALAATAFLVVLWGVATLVSALLPLFWFFSFGQTGPIGLGGFALTLLGATAISRLAAGG